MESIILSAIIAFGIFTAPVAAPSDTTNKYYINDELVESFDGSQIVGHGNSGAKIHSQHHPGLKSDGRQRDKYR